MLLEVLITSTQNTEASVINEKFRRQNNFLKSFCCCALWIRKINVKIGDPMNYK